MSSVQADLQDALGRYGLSSFRPGQAEVISNILAGQDCLCVMPTGGGKSLCYQLPSLVRSGMTIVISPLIALMKDQVDALQRRGIPATLINSTLSGSEQTTRLQQVTDGKFSLVYVAPERLRNQRFMEAIRATPIQLLAIDEAHCISEWGHDFRPDYARIGQFRDWLGGVQTIALTATATQRVRDDIIKLLKLRSPKQFITGFARNNLHLSVLTCRSDLEKERQMVDFLKTKPGYGIIYAATRKRCEELVALLSKELKMSVGAYHAGLSFDQRRFIQEQFMKGELQAIVATNAFGMGIDKSDLRFVIHYNMPGSLEAYYQEAGRAGRDGKPSQCMMLFSYQDRYIHEFFVQNSFPPASTVEQVYDYMLAREEDPIELTLQEIRDDLKLQLSPEAVGTSLQILSRTGVLERLESGAGLAMIRISSDLPTLVDMLPRSSERRRKVLRVLEKAVGDRRYEPVYVHPRWIMQHTDLSKEVLHDTMRELNKLEPIEYVPPFRGRATHIRRRDQSFSELNIDFKSLDEQMKGELAKLDEVIDFAESKRCRQLTILQYFGDPAAAPCGLCDRCQNRAGWLNLPSEDIKARISDATTQGNESKANSSSAKKTEPTALSGNTSALLRKVLLAVQRTHGRLGKTLIAQFLTGSENQKVQRLRMDRLADFGLLKPLKQADAVAILDYLLTIGMLEQKEVNKHRPTVSVSETGLSVAQSAMEFPTGVPLPTGIQRKLEALAKSPPQSNSTTWGTGSTSTSRPDPMKPLPKLEAKSLLPQPSQSSIPVQTNVVRTNTVQTNIVPTSIATPESRLQASRSPEGPVDRPVHAKTVSAETPTSRPSQTPLSFEDSSWNAIANKSVAEDAIADTSVGSEPPSFETAIEDWHWSWRLADSGFALFECAAIRRKTMDSVLRDLILALECNKRVPLESLLDREMLAAASRFLEDSQAAPATILRRFSALIPFLQAFRSQEQRKAPATSTS